MFFKHLNLNYNKNKLIKEFHSFNFIPYAITQTELEQDKSYFTEDYKPNSWFDKSDTWLIHRVRKFDNAPEILKLYDMLTSKLGLVRTSIFKQKAGTELPFHSDYKKVRCAVNIVLSDESAPIIFEDYGELKYECALLNITKRHKVPAFNKERMLLKFNIFETEFERAKDLLN